MVYRTGSSVRPKMESVQKNWKMPANQLSVVALLIAPLVVKNALTM